MVGYKHPGCFLLIDKNLIMMTLQLLNVIIQTILNEGLIICRSNFSPRYNMISFFQVINVGSHKFHVTLMFTMRHDCILLINLNVLISTFETRMHIEVELSDLKLSVCSRMLIISVDSIDNIFRLIIPVSLLS